MPQTILQDFLISRAPYGTWQRKIACAREIPDLPVVIANVAGFGSILIASVLVLRLLAVSVHLLILIGHFTFLVLTLTTLYYNTTKTSPERG